jgi:hypothetical protein
MSISITYRTDDGTRWGTGQGSDLAAVTIDLNFWNLFSAVTALQSQITSNATTSIDFISTVGNQLFVHLTNHAVEGPFVIPVAFWNPKGNWAPANNYVPLDVVSVDGALYITNVAHTSAATFSAFATDGLGHNIYTLLLEQPMDELPAGGTAGQRLVKASGSPYVTEWLSDNIRLALFIGGQPDPAELVLQYAVTDHMVFVTGLVGTVAFAQIPSSAPAVFQLNKNGAAIGTITFESSPPDASVAFSGTVACVPGDIISITAPSPQDASLADISLTIVAQLTL